MKTQTLSAGLTSGPASMWEFVQCRACRWPSLYARICAVHAAFQRKGHCWFLQESGSVSRRSHSCLMKCKGWWVRNLLLTKWPHPWLHRCGIFGVLSTHNDWELLAMISWSMVSHNEEEQRWRHSLTPFCNAVFALSENPLEWVVRCATVSRFVWSLKLHVHLMN